MGWWGETLPPVRPGHTPLTRFVGPPLNLPLEGGGEGVLREGGVQLHPSRERGCVGGGNPAARPPRAYPAHITPFVRAPFVARKGRSASPIKGEGMCWWGETLPPVLPGHTPHTRFACARPFRCTKGAENERG